MLPRFMRMRAAGSTLLVLFGLVPAGTPARADSAAPAPAPVVEARSGYSLARTLELAERNHPNVWGAQARLRSMRAQLDEARSTPFSQFTVTGGVGLAPTVRGTDLYSPNTDKSLTSSLGIAWRVGVDGVVPLWTFGKMTNLWNAAEAQVVVGESDVAKQRNQVKMDARKAFFGLQLARDSSSLLGEAGEKLDKAIDKLKQEVEGGTGDEIDLFRLQTFRYEIDGRRAEAQRYESIALAALSFLTGVAHGYDVPETPLRPPKRQLSPVARYLEAARLHRPEINMVRGGLLARQAQVELARSRYYPDLGLGVSASWARAPEVADQLNPYVRDDANYLRYGAALVFRWQLDMVPNAARVDQAEAALEELRQTERFALGGVGVEVETAYAQVVDAAARERAFGLAEKTARKWLIAVQQGIDVGTQEERDLVDPARQWALQRFSHLNAIMDLNVAWSNLALATGWDSVAPDGT